MVFIVIACERKKEKKHSTFNIHPDRFSSELHPSVARAIRPIHSMGASSWCYLPFISLPSVFFMLHLCPFYYLFLVHHIYLRSNPSLLFFNFESQQPHQFLPPLSCKLPSDQNLRWQFNEFGPSLMQHGFSPVAEASLFPTCDIFMFSPIGRNEINHRGKRRR